MSPASAGHPRRNVLLASSFLVSAFAIDISTAQAQQQQPAASERLPAVEVSPPKRNDRTQIKPSRDAGATHRAASRQVTSAQPKQDAQSPAAQRAQTPLNTGGVAESASRLGLTVREIPATVDV